MADFIKGKDFDDWFELNKDQIHEMIRNDPYELLYRSWFAGYQSGLDRMVDFVNPLWASSHGQDKQVDNPDLDSVE